jgi:hypothetical protein
MATTVHSRSADCVKSELDLFQVPPTQTSFDKACWQECPPTTGLTDGGPIEFHVSGSGNDYLDLMNTFLHLKVKITRADGTPTSGTTKVAPVNLMLHSLFSQVQVSLNGHSVGHSNAMYPYRAMIETLMNYTADGAEGHLQNALFYKDTPSYMDEGNPTLANHGNHIKGFNLTKDGERATGAAAALVPQTIGNQGLHMRWLFTQMSQWCDLIGPLHCDVFQQEKFLPSNVDLNVKLTRSKNAFSLMADAPPPEGYNISIQSASLYVRKVTIADHVFLAQQSAMMVSNAVYPISYVCMKSFTIPNGNIQGPSDNIFLGQLPVQMAIAFVDTLAMNGDYTKNPYNFKSMHLSELVVKYNGVQVPSKPFQITYDDALRGGGIHSRAYQHVFLGTGKLFMDKSSMIQREDFSRGYCIYFFDFRPDIGCRGHYGLKQTGSVQVDLRFAQPLNSTINMIVYAEFDSYFEVTGSREIITAQ